MKERYQAIMKMDYKTLVKEKGDLVSKYLVESAKLVSSGSKNTKKTNDIKKEIAWVETQISEKLYQEVEKA